MRRFFAIRMLAISSTHPSAGGRRNRFLGSVSARIIDDRPLVVLDIAVEFLTIAAKLSGALAMYGAGKLRDRVGAAQEAEDDSARLVRVTVPKQMSKPLRQDCGVEIASSGLPLTPLPRRDSAFALPERRRLQQDKKLEPLSDLRLATRPRGTGPIPLLRVARKGDRAMVHEGASLVVSHEDWLTARKELLAREKELTRQLDAVRAARRQLPCVEVEKSYVFEGAGGKRTLADLFGGRS